MTPGRPSILDTAGHHVIYCYCLVPPGRPSILDTAGQQIINHDVGPFEVGDSLKLTCVVQGGKFTA